MYLRSIVFSTCLLMAAAGATTNTSLTSILALVPQCGLKCLLGEVPPAALSNPAILCTNTTVQLSFSICILHQCNYTDQITMATLENQICEGYPTQESRSRMVAIFGLVFGPLALLAVALRFWSRATITKQIGADDWLILVAAACVVTLTVLNVYNCLANGYGSHIWHVDPRDKTQLLKLFYSCEIIYLVSMTLVKASVLLFYLRIFQSAWFRAADITLLAITVAAGAATGIGAVFQCIPISGSWVPGTGKCVDVNALAFASGAITVFLDILVLVLPVPELLKLQMSTKKKITILFMFSLGGLACITSIVRLKYMISFAKSKDATYDNAYAVIWTFLEVVISMICSCLPAIRGLLSKLFPSIFELTNQEPEKPFSHSNRNSKLHQFARLEKRGPSYNKWALPTDTMMSEPFEMESNVIDVDARENENTGQDGNKQTKIWIHPNRAGELMAFVDEQQKDNLESRKEGADRGLSMAASQSTETSLWCLEGPRVSEDARRVMDLGSSMGASEGGTSIGGDGSSLSRGNSAVETGSELQLVKTGETRHHDMEVESAESGVPKRGF